jgi:TonB family protein
MTKNLFLTAVLAMALALSSHVARVLSSQETWQKIQPVGESFTILMPTLAKEGTRVVPLSPDDSVPARVYYSVADGRRYLVMSFQKTEAERTPLLSGFDVFMKGVEQSFKSKMMTSADSLVFDREIMSGGSNGRQYQMKLGRHAGIAQFLETEKAFYGLMVIGSDEKNVEVERFLSSFALVPTNSKSESSGVIVDPLDYGRSVTSSSANSADVVPPEPWPKPARPIIAGVLNGKAISLPKPEYPSEARAAGDSGTVEVQIVIDEQGGVILAETSSGPPSLREAAARAARKARFSPTRLMGQPIKVSGRVIYNFLPKPSI